MNGEDALQRARDAYAGSTNYFNANIRQQIERDLRQFQSRHGPESKYSSPDYKGRSRIYRPKTRGVIRKNEAQAAEAFFSTLDPVSISAQNEKDPLQQASAEVMQELIKHRLSKTVPWFQLAMGAYQDAQATGIVISHQDWSHRPKRRIDTPKIDLIPVENFRFDPGASWINPVETSPYLIWLIPMYVKDIRKKMKDAKWKTYTDSQLLAAKGSYTDSTRLVREDNRTDSRDATTSLTAYTVVWVHMNIMEGDDDEDFVFYTLGDRLLLTDPVPLSKRYPHLNGRRPFVIGSCVIETHKVYPSGVSRLSRDLQAEINEVANQRMDNVKFAMNKRYFVARNKQVDIRSLTRNVPGSVTLVNNTETDVKVMDTPDVTSSSYQEQDRLNLDFDDISGNFSSSSVASNRNLNETVGGMELLTAPLNQVSAYQLKTFVETWVEPVLRQLILLEQSYETDDTLLALAGQASAGFQKLGQDTVTDELLLQELTLSVSVGMSATSPTQKVNTFLVAVNGIKTALADGVLEKYGIDATEVVKEVFGAIGHRDGGRFFKALGDEDPQVVALRKQVETLQQALDAKHPKELIAAQVRESDARALKTGVEAAYGAMQAAEVIATVPAVAPVADKVMQNAGYQTPNPAGVDPNYPTGPQAMAEAGLTALETGAAAQPTDVIPDGANTNPMTPRPTGTGMLQGIETQRADGAGV